MTEKEMIEEMARVIESVKLYGIDNYGRKISHDSVLELAEELLKHYRPKLPEGSVVLSEGEYSDILEDEVETLERDIAEYWVCLDIDAVARELHKDGYRKLDDHAIMTLRKAKGLEERTRKETAMEFAKSICKMLWNRGKDKNGKTFDYGDLTSIDVYELAKQFGVEVEE